MRHVLIPLTFAFASMSGVAYADSAHADTAKTTQAQAFELPSQTEIEEMIEKLPDFNAIIGDVIEMTKDEKIQKRMERSGEAFSEKLEESGALEPDENGIPDIKLALKVMMLALSDEEVTGGMVETLTELQTLMEKHIPETSEVEPTE